MLISLNEKEQLYTGMFLMVLATMRLYWTVPNNQARIWSNYLNLQMPWKLLNRAT